MEIYSLILPDATLLEFSLFYNVIYILLAVLSGVIIYLILILRNKSKKVNDFQYNLSLSMTLSSIITCLSIPVITYFTHYHTNPFYALPHSYIFDVTLLYLYTITIPIAFFLVLSMIFFIWYRNRRKTLVIEFNQKLAERKVISTEQ